MPTSFEDCANENVSLNSCIISASCLLKSSQENISNDADSKHGSAVPKRQNAVNSKRLITNTPSTISPSLTEISIDSSVMPSSLIFLYASCRFQSNASTHRYSCKPEASSISSHQNFALSGITPTGWVILTMRISPSSLQTSSISCEPIVSVSRS